MSMRYERLCVGAREVLREVEMMALNALAHQPDDGKMCYDSLRGALEAARGRICDFLGDIPKRETKASKGRQNERQKRCKGKEKAKVRATVDRR